jgi:cyclopropane-fatty-acyl-phospholipid synthase
MRKVNRATVSALERRMCQRLLETRGDPRLRLVLWNGEELRCSDAPPVGRVVLRDRRLIFDLALHPDVGLGDAYASGRLEIEGDLTAVLKLVLKDERPRTLGVRFREQWALWRRRSRSLRTSVENIHSHYDLGNDFYKLWLDERMAYTCAYFPTPTASLEEAQLAKMDHVARKVWLRPGERVVEAGCGWGSLALHMARHYGVHVTAYNISSEQIAWARERATSEGL